MKNKFLMFMLAILLSPHSFSEWTDYDTKTHGSPEALALYREGEVLEKAGKLKKTAELYIRSAEKGNSWAQYKLGHMYLTGNGVEKNIKESLKWLKKSADRDHIFAGQDYEMFKLLDK